LIDKFISEYLFVVDKDESNVVVQKPLDKDKDKMNWQNMLYLWKQFLHSNQLPLTLFQSMLKPMLTQTHFSNYYKPDGDYFIGIGSSQWPMIQTFLRYWNETMVYDENEMELEIEEITNLFRHWGETVRTYKWEVFSLTEYQILDVISYFFPHRWWRGWVGPLLPLLSTYRVTSFRGGRAINSPSSAAETFALFLPNFKPF
jgi:hypothetical protein